METPFFVYFYGSSIVPYVEDKVLLEKGFPGKQTGTMVCCRLSWKHGPGQRTVEQQICFQRDYSLGNRLPGYKL